VAPDKQILTVISKQERELEIQRRLQTNEVRKARQLLALATGTHLSALNIHKDLITQQIMKVSKNG
jgi:hypothetical protein